MSKTALLDATAKFVSPTGIGLSCAAEAEFEVDVSYSTLNQLLFPLSEAFGDLDSVRRRCRNGRPLRAGHRESRAPDHARPAIVSAAHKERGPYHPLPSTEGEQSVRSRHMDDTGTDGRTTVVIGATSGIGFEVAKQLAMAGARVILAVRDADKGRAALDAIRTTVDGRGGASGGLGRGLPRLRTTFH